MNLGSLALMFCWILRHCSPFYPCFGSVPGVSIHQAHDKNLWAGYQFLGQCCIPQLFCFDSQMQPQQGCNPSLASPACVDRFSCVQGSLILVSPPSRMARSLYEWLWQHEFWLPPGITWEDMQESEDTHYPQPRELLLSIPFALILVVIRCAFER